MLYNISAVNVFAIQNLLLKPTEVSIGSHGLKAYVMNKPIDAHTEKGIRTLLNQNFNTDFKMFIKSTFSVTAWKDTIKYNMKYSSLKGMFSDGVAWKNRKTCHENTRNI